MSDFVFQSPDSDRLLDDADKTRNRISELGGHVQRSGNQWTIQCPHPNHPDIHPSAKLKRGENGQALIHCFSCANSNTPQWLDDVLSRLTIGTQFAQAKPRNSSNGSAIGQGERVAEYEYLDLERRKFFKVRYESESGGKSFEWFREVQDSKISGLGHSRLNSLLPYGSELLTKSDEAILWVEGEKDVDRARTAGLMAVTSGGGAHGPLPDELGCLRGRHVFVVADNDPAGMSYAKRVKVALEGIAQKVTLSLPALPDPGSDLFDHLDAGLGLDDLVIDEAAQNAFDKVPLETATSPASRQIILTKASEIEMRPVTWVWQDRFAEGSLALLAGREGQGKSTVAAWIVASITRGTLPGVHLGIPKSVFISASEDSWESTVVPRLSASGADLDRVFRVEVITTTGLHGDLSMPADIPRITELAIELDVALLVLDPLMSRIASNIDTHRDAEVRQALEPLAVFANTAKVTVIGLAHFNKSANADPLNAVMASKAFTAVARSVHTVIRDVGDEGTRYFGTAKNNLGRDDLPLIAFTIEGHRIPLGNEEIWTSRIVWGQEVNESVRDVMVRANDPTDRTSANEAAEWLSDYLVTQGGKASSSDIKKVGQVAGHSISSLKRAKLSLGLEVQSQGFPRETFWFTTGSTHDHTQSQVSSQLAQGKVLEPTEPTDGNPAVSTPLQKGRVHLKSPEPSPKAAKYSEETLPKDRNQESVLFCRSCGGAMPEDLFVDGLHATCI